MMRSNTRTVCLSFNKYYYSLLGKSGTAPLGPPTSGRLRSQGLARSGLHPQTYALGGCATNLPQWLRSLVMVSHPLKIHWYFAIKW